MGTHSSCFFARASFGLNHACVTCLDSKSTMSKTKPGPRSCSTLSSLLEMIQLPSVITCPLTSMASSVTPTDDPTIAHAGKERCKCDAIKQITSIWPRQQHVKPCPVVHVLGCNSAVLTCKSREPLTLLPKFSRQILENQLFSQSLKPSLQARKTFFLTDRIALRSTDDRRR